MFEDKSPRKAPAFDWVLWIEWLLATTLGWAAGWAISESAVGLAIGLAQWIVLRTKVDHSEWWILASGISWAAARGLVGAVLPPQSTVLIGAVQGTALGTAQWIVLRHHVVQPWWWIVISALSWGVAFTAFLGEPLIGAIAGAFTGLALEPQLRYSASHKDEEAT